MIYNKSTSLFSHWMDELKQVAGSEYNLSLGFNFHEQELYQYYHAGMDIHEAIKTYQETLVTDEN
jgi:hypothetical protein